jgi:LPXTG-site transpeptidase (sortase) family protein
MFDFFKVTPKKRKVKIRSKRGVIYSNPNKRKKIVFYFGNLVLIFAVISFVYLYFPLAKAIFNYNIKHSKLSENIKPSAEYTDPQPQGEDEFSIQIPEILASSKIVKNVSPYFPSEYLKVLENDVIAHAEGTDLPGEGIGKSTYLFAHSTRQGIGMVRKNSVFYLLGDLKNEDVIFIKYNGKIYKYLVFMKKIVNASEVNYINYKEPSKEIIILQTCWPLGTDWKRLLVFAERI